MSSLEIFQLNHASLLLALGEIRLLTDPWFEGYAFDGGWQLRWQNPEAYATAATATHLWISHPHSDHLHHPTLKRLHALNPNITLITNTAYNYDVQKQLRSLGFHSFLPLHENQPLRLSKHCTLERIGSSIIDSLLVIRWENFTLLNLNDCVLQTPALRHIARKIGTIDLLMCNFNHAGKLLHYPEIPAEQMRETLKQHYRMQVSILKPRCVVPFASLHRYTSPLSVQQNAAMLDPTELEGIALYPGQHATIALSSSPVTHTTTGPIPARSSEPAPELPAVSPDALTQSIALLERRLSSAFGPLRFFLPSLSMRIIEDQRLLRLRHGRIRETTAPPDIEAHRAHVTHWFTSTYGTDAFIVGAHLRILRPCTTRLKCLIALLLLAEAKISPRHALNPALWKFLFRRRHEAFAALRSLRVSSSYQ
ncbi:MAG: MBL fold metallo-hydrolase [Rickettsiales bacterium]|nr:MBL fold metallo-hydrolase [Rickettsiales bacterium]